jgi:hypothetical protein
VRDSQILFIKVAEASLNLLKIDDTERNESAKLLFGWADGS